MDDASREGQASGGEHAQDGVWEQRGGGTLGEQENPERRGETEQEKRHPDSGPAA